MRFVRAHRVSLLSLAVLVAAAIGVAVALHPKPATACPPYSNVQYKYAEPQLINHVGTRWVNCWPPYIVQEGQMTIYSVTEWGDDCGCCPAGGCR
jgi:hypothetical protein